MLTWLAENWYYIFIGQGLIGLALCEFGYRGLDRMRDVVEERDREWPSWRRRDVKNHARWKYYPGAFTVLIPKLLIFAMAVLLWTICFMILYGCSCRSRDRPPQGCSNKIMKIVY